MTLSLSTQLLAAALLLAAAMLWTHRLQVRRKDAGLVDAVWSGAYRAFKTSRAAQLVFAVLGASAVQRGPLWWAGHRDLKPVPAAVKRGARADGAGS